MLIQLFAMGDYAPDLKLAMLYGGVIFLVGLICIIADLSRDSRNTRPPLLPWSAPWQEVLFFFWICCMGLLLGIVFTPLLLSIIGINDGDQHDSMLASYAFSQVIILVVLYLGAKSRPQGFPPMDSTDHALSRIRMGLFYCLSAMPLLALVGHAWQWAFKLWAEAGIVVEAPPQDLVTRLIGQTDPLSFFLAVIVAVLLAPFIEEIVFRAGLYRYLKGHVHQRIALVISALLFSLVHFNLFSFLPLFLLGLLLARAYEKTGSLITVIAMHAFFNLNTLIMLRLKPADFFGVWSLIP